MTIAHVYNTIIQNEDNKIKKLQASCTAPAPPAFRQALKTHFYKLALFLDFIHSIYYVLGRCIDYVMHGWSIFARMHI